MEGNLPALRLSAITGAIEVRLEDYGAVWAGPSTLYPSMPR
jgi:hypothetical protein